MFQISPEQWMCSAAQVTAHGEGLAAGHLTSDYRLQAAQVGWQGASATALNAKKGDWWEASRALLTRIGDHARGLHEAAVIMRRRKRSGHGRWPKLVFPPAARPLCVRRDQCR